MDLTLLVEDVGRYLAAGNRQPGQACSAMRRLVGSPALAAEVRRALGAREEVRRLSEGSQVHPNSFDKIPLLRTGPGLKLVLHRWFAAGGAAGESIHDHRWDFCSAVLGGELCSEEYVERADGPVLAYTYAYRSPGAADHYTLAFRGERRVALSGTAVHRAGAVYHQPHDVLHRARASDPGTMTLIVQGPVLADGTTVHRPSPAPAALRRVQRMETAAVRDALTGLLRALPSPPGI